MNYTENTGGGYESMVWLQDREGKEFACYSDDIKTPAEIIEKKSKCMDVNSLIGTERW